MHPVVDSLVLLTLTTVSTSYKMQVKADQLLEKLKVVEVQNMQRNHPVNLCEYSYLHAQ